MNKNQELAELLENTKSATERALLTEQHFAVQRKAGGKVSGKAAKGYAKPEDNEPTEAEKQKALDAWAEFQKFKVEALKVVKDFKEKIKQAEKVADALTDKAYTYEEQAHRKIRKWADIYEKAFGYASFPEVPKEIRPYEW